jgi:hypothetical protein
MPRGRAQGGFFRNSWFLAHLPTFVVPTASAAPIALFAPGTAVQIAIGTTDVRLKGPGRRRWSRAVLVQQVKKLAAATPGAVKLDMPGGIA